jgi:hypothetical protein
MKKLYHKRKTLGVGDLGGEKADTPAYPIWYAMLKRCYSYEYLKNNRTYRDCKVCDEWLFFPNFKKWYEENHKPGFDLDKDILGKDLYSEDTCCFVPPQINTVIICGSGVRKSGSKFRAVMSVEGKDTHLGVFDTEEEARACYVANKEVEISRVAYKYYVRNDISRKIYKSLISYPIGTNTGKR